MVFSLIASFVFRGLGLPTIEWVGNPPATGEVGELRISNLVSVANPYDQDLIRVVCEVRRADGSIRTVPAFFYQPMKRSISGAYESISAQGSAEWRARITPAEPGRLQVLARVTVSGSSAESNKLEFVPKRQPYRGFVKRSTCDPQGLVYGDGTPFRAVGENLCWPGSRGTYDYDMWIASLKSSGVNYVRLWCSPWYFGFETAPGQLLNYNQKPLWALDYVMRALKEAGIGVILCLDYHGMLESTPDYWGGNDNWKINPYNQANGGPCASQNAFFTSNSAKATYKKRLGYLIGRYSAFPNLVAWELWNEIDNVLTYLNKPDVVAWHNEMAAYLKANDPCGHLVTTSLSGSWWPELWSVPGMDFVQVHSYGQSNPGVELPKAMEANGSAFGKPVIVGEYGVDWRGYGAEQDPYHRGLHQALWGTFVSTGFGCAQTWWWESIHSDNLYSHFKAMSSVSSSASRGENWSPLAIDVPGLDAVLGDVDPLGSPFEAVLTPNMQWGAVLSGSALIRDELTAACDSGNLNAFVHGSWHADLRIPCKITAHFGSAASMTIHLNSVSDQCRLVVKVNGSVVYSVSLPNKDGLYQVNNEYNEDILIPLPPGRNVIEISNPGGDWFFYDWLKFTNVLPAKRVGPGMPLVAVGSGRTDEAWVWLLDYAANYPNNAQRPSIRELSGAEATVRNLADGTYDVRWFDTRTGALVRTDLASSSGGAMRLAPPAFTEDIFASIEPQGRRYVSGSVSLGDWIDANPIPSTMQVKVMIPGTESVVGQCSSPVTALGGFRFSLPAPPGVYDVRFKTAHWLSTKIRIDASGSHVQGIAIQLPNGDVNGDNRVDLLDWNLLSQSWRTKPGDAKWNPNADLNGDQTVDLLDFNILSKNWRMQGK